MTISNEVLKEIKEKKELLIGNYHFFIDDFKIFVEDKVKGYVSKTFFFRNDFELELKIYRALVDLESFEKFLKILDLNSTRNLQVRVDIDSVYKSFMKYEITRKDLNESLIIFYNRNVDYNRIISISDDSSGFIVETINGKYFFNNTKSVVDFVKYSV